MFIVGFNPDCKLHLQEIKVSSPSYNYDVDAASRIREWASTGRAIVDRRTKKIAGPLVPWVLWLHCRRPSSSIVGIGFCKGEPQLQITG